MKTTENSPLQFLICAFLREDSQVYFVHAKRPLDAFS